MFDTLRLFMMTTNLFVIPNLKKLRTGGSFRILLPFFRASWGVGVLNSEFFLTVSTIGLSLARFWRAFGISGGFETPQNPLGTPLPVNSFSVSLLTRISGWSSEDNDDFDGENNDDNINFWFTMNFIMIYIITK